MNTPHQPPTQQEENTAFYQAALHTLISIGTNLAQNVQAARTTQPPEISATEAAEAFERVSRATRRTILLATRLQNELAKDPAHDPASNRRVVIRAIEDAITAEPETDAPTRERLESEFRERLDTPEFAEDLTARPVKDVIADILRDLHLGALPWTRSQHRRRTPATLRRLHAQARGEPLPPQPPPNLPPDPQPAPTDLVGLHRLILSTTTASQPQPA